MSVTTPAGFRAAGVAAGLKTTGGKDVALVVNDGPTFDSATVFTANRCKANPVLWSQEVVKDGTVRAVVLNSGGANCYTGPEGFQTTHAVAEQVAGHLGVGAIDVVVCSTGLIGLTNDRDHLLAGVDAAYDALAADGGQQARRGDHDHRLGEQAGRRRGRRLVDRRDGQGRRHARAPAGHHARRASPPTPSSPPPTSTPRCAPRPGSASTGSTPTAACRPTTPSPCWPAAPAGSPRRCPTSPTALTQVCTDLAMQLLRDAEGADHDIAITTLNAATEDEAVEVGRSVARATCSRPPSSARTPTGAGSWPASAPRSAAFDPADLDVAMNGVWVCKRSDAARRPRRPSTSSPARSP